ncbi:MAG: carbohydrate kinase family protein [Clostridiales bacterium]|nr:carbohydrate kinase family protein [Clostridiales bacterium]
MANTGLALKKLGNDVRLLGKAGTDTFGDLLESILKGYGAEGLIRDSSCSTSYTVVLALQGIDRIFLHCPGANASFLESDIPDDALKDAALLHFGYPPLMKGMYQNSGSELKKLFVRAKGAGCATSLDMAAVDPLTEAGRQDWEAILRSVLPEVDFFLPSFEELCFMLDRSRYDELSSAGEIVKQISFENDVIPLSEKCLQMGCGVCVIKCGDRGMYYACAGRERLDAVGRNAGFDPGSFCDRRGIQPCFRVERVVSAAGAGDTAIAAWLTAMLRGKDAKECVRLAAAEGACCVGTLDALSGLMDLDELEKQISSGRMTENRII